MSKVNFSVANELKARFEVICKGMNPSMTMSCALRMYMARVVDDCKDFPEVSHVDAMKRIGTAVDTLNFMMPAIQKQRQIEPRSYNAYKA